MYKGDPHNTIHKSQKLETNQRPIKSRKDRTSLVAQWLRIRLPMQGTQVRALVREDPTCLKAPKPMRHNY